MAIPLQNLIDNPDLLAKLMGPEIKCANCGEPICALTGINRSPKGLVCVDCYYSLISEEIEKHPPHKKIGGFQSVG